MSDDIYKNSTLATKFKNEKWKKYKVLFTDIDDTYICSSTGCSDEQESTIDATRELTTFLKTNAIPVIAVTARNIDSVLQGHFCNTEYFPEFDIIATCLGTEIWIRQNNGKYKLDKEYFEKVRLLSQFNRKKIYSLLQSFILDHSGYGMRFQPQYERFQSTVEHFSPFKISFDFTATPAQSTKIKQKLRSIFSENGLSKVKILIFMAEKLEGDIYQYCCDITAATKDSAVSYIQKKFNCRGIVAGNSGNDRHMIMNSGDLAIVVGACKIDLLAEIQRYSKHMTKYLSTFKNEDIEKIVYIEPETSKRIGPQSILRALQLFMEYKILLHHVNPFKVLT